MGGLGDARPMLRWSGSETSEPTKVCSCPKSGLPGGRDGRQHMAAIRESSSRQATLDASHLSMKLPSNHWSIEPAVGLTLTLSLDPDVFTLMTGTPLDLSITTVRSVPRLPVSRGREKLNADGGFRLCVKRHGHHCLPDLVVRERSEGPGF